MNHIDTMKLALEALEGIHPGNMTPMAEEYWNKAITALREALAEQSAQQVVDSEEKAGAYIEARLWEFIDMAAAWPEASPDPRTWDHVMVYAPKPAQKEPVAWMNAKRDMTYLHGPYNADDIPLYTSPPAQRKPLTDEQLYKVFPAIATYTEANKTLYRSIARLIEAAHSIKEQP